MEDVPAAMTNGLEARRPSRVLRMKTAQRVKPAMLGQVCVCAPTRIFVTRVSGAIRTQAAVSSLRKAVVSIAIAPSPSTAAAKINVDQGGGCAHRVTTVPNVVIPKICAFPAGPAA